MPSFIGLLTPLITNLPAWLVVLSAAGTLITFIVLLNILQQVLVSSPNKPPLVFHLVSWIGNTIEALRAEKGNLKSNRENDEQTS